MHFIANDKYSYIFAIGILYNSKLRIKIRETINAEEK